jgi:O-methyltransferase involved in polyketide biosynthesis
MAHAAGVSWETGQIRAAVRRLAGGKFGSGLYLQLRYDALSEALEAYAGCPVLELGAGFSTRGLVEAPLREAYLETDLGKVLMRKQSAVEKLGGRATNHYFEPLNVTSDEDVDRVCRLLDALRLTKPLVIVHEGLFMYLSPHEQVVVRDNLCRLMARPKAGSVWLTSDFSERDLDRGLLQRFMSRRLSNQVRRRLNYFESEEAVERFLAEAGLRADWLPNVTPVDAPEHAYAEYFRIHRITIAR